MTLNELKKEAKGRTIKVYVRWCEDDGDHFDISLASFLRTVGEDDGTDIDAFVIADTILIN